MQIYLHLFVSVRCNLEWTTSNLKLTLAYLGNQMVRILHSCLVLFFKRYSNILTKVKSLSKKLHFSAKIDKEQNDPQKIWNTIRSTIPTSNVLTATPTSLNIKWP